MWALFFWQTKKNADEDDKAESLMKVATSNKDKSLIEQYFKKKQIPTEANRFKAIDYFFNS